MKIIEMIVRKDIALHLNVKNELGEISNRMAGLHKLYPDPFFKKVEHLLINILADEKYTYYHCTKARSLYTSKQKQGSVGKTLVEKYTQTGNILLYETAMYVKLSL